MPSPCAAAFAVPGDLTSLTGGYHYDRQLLAALRAAGRDVAHVALPDGFPFPTPADMARAEAQLADNPACRVLIVDGLALGALGTAALDRLRTPLVALVHHPLAHESGLPPAEARRLHRLEQANLERAAHILVPSPHIADLLVADYAVDASRITVIRPGKPEGPALPPAATPSMAPPLILSVGILHPRKGHDVLIAALAQLADLDWRAVIVGSPWEPGHDAALAQQIEAADLGARITLAGRIERDALDSLYREAHIFALATRFEGYGIVFDEALICGLPIVSTTAGAVPGTVPEAAGSLVPPEDAGAFADALRALLEDEGRHAEMAAAAARAGAALPSWDDAAAKVGRILDHVAGVSA
ncbi:glycosyltransferase family 4 protein [Roseovarius sp. D0-M9]|uniref:glycosyltransferase family 4 protein n=1 Tax=Roseovarius sp. D0-M9 TaxID=3127117 RepID=UPI00300FB607